MKGLIKFLREYYTAQEAEEAIDHIGDIKFSIYGLRYFIFLVDNVHIKPDRAVLYGIDKGPYQNVICYSLRTSPTENAIKFFVCGHVLGTPDIEESESLMEEING